MTREERKAFLIDRNQNPIVVCTNKDQYCERCNCQEKYDLWQSGFNIGICKLPLDFSTANFKKEN